MNDINRLRAIQPASASDVELEEIVAGLRESIVERARELAAAQSRLVELRPLLDEAERLQAVVREHEAAGHTGLKSDKIALAFALLEREMRAGKR